MSQKHFDVIIIGGRPAGASLAIRLARQKLNVLVVDRATFPSFPAVASSPIIYEGTMKMLDELGLKEEEYTLPGSRIDQMVLDFVNYFNVVMPTSLMGLERSYIRGLDRPTFDNAVWRQMERHAPYVTARQGFSVTDITKDENGRVTGIVGKPVTGGEEERFTADLVVGADGRYSMAAKRFGAKIEEERNEYTNGGFQAQWENVRPYEDGMSSEACLYNTARGFIIVFMPLATGRYHVCAFMRSQDINRGKQSLEEYYLEQLQRIPKAWKRLEGARRVSDIEGMRSVENGYREAFGNGWALVGDAFHYKDPIDGQGIHDAMIGSKHLAEAIGQWKRGELTWEQAGTQYKEKTYASTYAMFKVTSGRAKREMHTFPPPFVLKTLIPALLTDPGYQTKFMRTLARVEDPASLPSMPTAGMLWRYLLRSLRGQDKPQPRVTLRDTATHRAV